MSSLVVTSTPDDIKLVDPDDRTTIPVLTKFEKTKIIGVRMEQIANGATPMVSTDDLEGTEAIVEEELKQRTLPMLILRPLPNGHYEQWELKELIN